MKRAKGLWAQVVSFENLLLASRRALRGKRSRAQPAEFFRDLETQVLRLQAELSSGEYRPGPYRTFHITDPKPRLISAAPFRDRVVHHAIVQVIEPAYERRFIHHSYACRPGKGNHAALAQFVGWARASGTVLKMDVRRYFPCIDHEILKAQLRRALADRPLLALIDHVIDGSNPQGGPALHFAGDDLFSPHARRRGLPIGNLTSQFLANVYLDGLDHHLTDALGVRRYLRYMDDMVVCDPDKGRLREVRAAAREYLMGLRLRLNEGKSRVHQLREGIPWLGFVVGPEHVRLAPNAVRRARRRMDRSQASYRAGAPWAEVEASLRAWDAHLRHGDTWRLRVDVYARRPFVRARPSPGLRGSPADPSDPS